MSRVAGDIFYYKDQHLGVGEKFFTSLLPKKHLDVARADKMEPLPNIHDIDCEVTKKLSK